MRRVYSPKSEDKKIRFYAVAALSERRPDYATVRDRRYNNLSARRSSRGSSKLQLPKDLTNLRRHCRRSVSIFQSPHAKKSRLGRAMLTVKEQELVDLFARVKRDELDT